MTERNLIMVLLVLLVVGCGQSKTDSGSTRMDETGKSNSTSSAKPSDTIKIGRVTLLTHKVEMGNLDTEGITQGLKGAVKTLDTLLAEENLKAASGLYVVRFRLEPDGVIRML